MKVAAVIPARLGSRRFPRKVLARETGKYLVEHVYERVEAARGRDGLIDRVIIATDSEEVREACSSFGAEVRLTSTHHVSGTDRVAEVAESLPHAVVINVQGDEPLIEPDDLRTLIKLFEEGGEGVVMTTLVARRWDLEGFRDPNIVKAVVGQGGNALYFSRAPVPYGGSPPPEPGKGHPPERAPERAPEREGQGSAVACGGARKGTSKGTSKGTREVEWFQHIGIYAYRREFLLRLSKLPPTPLEERERLEQLRVLENGYTIRAGITPHEHLGIDTEEEYRRFVREYLQGLHRPPASPASAGRQKGSLTT
jgi:3-deoxy-manno-octulosonate cytidylyltransferase (CMP-KDO synthetase)